MLPSVLGFLVRLPDPRNPLGIPKPLRGDPPALTFSTHSVDRPGNFSARYCPYASQTSGDHPRARDAMTWREGRRPGFVTPAVVVCPGGFPLVSLEPLHSKRIINTRL